MPRRSPSGSRSPTPSPRRGSRSRSPRRSRTPTPSRSRSRSVSPGNSRSRSPRTPSRSRSRTPRRSQSPQRSKSPASLGSHQKDGLDGVDLDYDFVPVDEETPTFSLAKATLDLVRDRVYQTAPLNKKHFNELKKDKYMMAREVNETLEPKPVPPQVVSSLGGVDLMKLHGSLLHLHKVSRVSQRPIWALIEQLQKSRKYVKGRPSTQFYSPPFMGTGDVPDGFVKLDYTEDDEKRFGSSAPNKPSEQDFKDAHRSLGVHIKFHAEASRSMTDMAEVIRQQQLLINTLSGSMDGMWGRTQDYLNMSRYQESHLKEMRRSQLVKAHTKEFCDWLDNIYMKDKDRVNERDKSDEILAAEYDSVIRQFNEDRKHKNVALKRRPHNPRYNYKANDARSAPADHGAGGSGQGGGGASSGASRNRSNKGGNNYNKKGGNNNSNHNKKGGNNNANNGNNGNKDNGGDSRDSGGRSRASNDSKKNTKKGRTA